MGAQVLLDPTLAVVSSETVEPAVRVVVEKTANYTITAADIAAGIAFVGNPAGPSMTFALASAATWAGRTVRIANTSSTAGSKTVDVDGYAAELVGGEASVTLSPGDAFTFMSDGSNVLVF